MDFRNKLFEDYRDRRIYHVENMFGYDDEEFVKLVKGYSEKELIRLSNSNFVKKVNYRVYEREFQRIILFCMRYRDEENICIFLEILFRNAVKHYVDSVQYMFGSLLLLGDYDGVLSMDKILVSFQPLTAIRRLALGTEEESLYLLYDLLDFIRDHYKDSITITSKGAKGLLADTVKVKRFKYASFLIQNGFSIQYISEKSGDNLLTLSVKFKDVPISFIEKLMIYGINVDHTCFKLKNAMDYAMMNNRNDIVKLLLTYGA